jgi:hypothetical protein
MTRRLVISKIVGGLGNQLFCYAAARACVKNDAVLCLDVNFSVPIFDTGGNTGLTASCFRRMSCCAAAQTSSPARPLRMAPEAQARHPWIAARPRLPD